MSGTGRTGRTARELFRGPTDKSEGSSIPYASPLFNLQDDVQPPGQCQAVSDLSSGAATIKTLLCQVDYCFWWYVRSIWRLSDGYLFIFSLKEYPLFNPIMDLFIRGYRLRSEQPHSESIPLNTKTDYGK